MSAVKGQERLGMITAEKCESVYCVCVKTKKTSGTPLQKPSTACFPVIQSRLTDAVNRNFGELLFYGHSPFWPAPADHFLFIRVKGALLPAARIAGQHSDLKARGQRAALRIAGTPDSLTRAGCAEIRRAALSGWMRGSAPVPTPPTKAACTKRGWSAGTKGLW
jgi:hypothetical protein